MIDGSSSGAGRGLLSRSGSRLAEEQDFGDGGVCVGFGGASDGSGLRIYEAAHIGNPILRQDDLFLPQRAPVAVIIDGEPAREFGDVIPGEKDRGLKG
jgi:hypothetical protein